MTFIVKSFTYLGFLISFIHLIQFATALRIMFSSWMWLVNICFVVCRWLCVGVAFISFCCACFYYDQAAQNGNDKMSFYVTLLLNLTKYCFSQFLGVLLFSPKSASVHRIVMDLNYVCFLITSNCWCMSEDFYLLSFIPYVLVLLFIYLSLL